MACKDGYYSMGSHTLSVSMELFSLNRSRLCDSLKVNNNVPENALVLLQGGDIIPFYCTDVEYNVFRQEPYFHWAFGINEAGCYGAIQVSDKCSILFVPRYPDEYTVWMGKFDTLEEIAEKYRVDKVYYKDQMVQVIKEISPDVILTLNGINSDSGLTTKEAEFDGKDGFPVNNKILHAVMAQCRVIKTPMEQHVMRYVAGISSDAHKVVMQKTRPGMHEYQCEAIFLHYVYTVGGCRHVSYTCICASGENGSILHYGHAGKPNDKEIKDGDLCTYDMGAAYCGYASDITVTYPANGKFTKEQKDVYNAVLAANLEVQKAIKPGVSWVDMHLLANRTLLEHLKNMNILRGDLDEMMQVGLAAIFQPHGLGHLLGIDVHDVGGYIEGTPSRREEPGVKNLRTARILEEGMALTVEPGCYFIDKLLDETLEDPSKAKFINETELKKFRGIGGVRIEDDVFVTKDGVENYTFVPRTVEEIECWMAEGNGN